MKPACATMPSHAVERMITAIRASSTALPIRLHLTRVPRGHGFGLARASPQTQRHSVFDRPAFLRFLGTAIMVFGAVAAIVVTAATLYLWRAEPCTTPSQCEERAAFSSL